MAMAGKLLIFGILWAALTEGDPSQLGLGVGIVVLAVLSPRLIPVGARAPRSPIRLRAIAAYLAYFFYHSLKGGIDVAYRAFRIGRPVRPVYLSYPLRIPHGIEGENARIVFATSICVFPGSLSCVFREDTLIIQVLDEEIVDLPSIRRLEELVCDLFSISLPPGRVGPS